MKKTTLLLATLFVLGQFAVTTDAQQKSPDKPKNEITKLIKARKKNHTVRQITPSPKKSPGKHADNLSKNVNHEMNRESKDVNHGLNKLSKDINHSFQGKKKKK